MAPAAAAVLAEGDAPRDESIIESVTSAATDAQDVASAPPLGSEKPKKQKPPKEKNGAATAKPQRAAPSLKQRAALRSEAKKPKAQRGPSARQKVRHSGFGRWFRRSALGESVAAWTESRRVRSKIKDRRGSAARGRRPGR